MSVSDAPSGPDPRDRLSHLPLEIVHRVLASVADPATLARLCCVSKHWSVLASRDAHWRPMYLSHWRKPRVQAAIGPARHRDGGGDPSIEAASWKQLYGHRAALDRRWLRGRPRKRRFAIPRELVHHRDRRRVHACVGAERLDGASSVGRGRCSDLVGAAAPRHVRRGRRRRPDRPDGSYDQAVRVWDVATGECKMVLLGHQGSVAQVGWIGSLIFSVSASPCEAKLWDGATGDLVRTFESAALDVCDWKTNGDRLFSLSWKSAVQTWNLATSGVVVRGNPSIPRSTVGNIVVGASWLFGTSEHEVNMWDISPGRKARTFTVPDMTVQLTKINASALCISEWGRIGLILEFGADIPLQ
ncbi:hypothetical protein DFJ73DRAFT_956774 [Zopfochytrium polystomum]|nr:hypothetical protein DFJ73DRAFT_956774 [Zopfochytrium polystomum]